MSVGGDAYIGVLSYLAIVREATWGSYPGAPTSTCPIPFLSASFKTDFNSEKLDTMGFRANIRRVQLEKTVAGSLEMYLHPEESTLLLANCLGGGVTSSSLTGAYTHSISAGNMVDTSPTSVAFSMKKGNGMVFNYTGGRVNEMKISAQVGEVAKVNFDMVFKDSTVGASDLQSALSYSSVLPFTFVQGVFRYQSSEANAATTTAEEPILGFELTVSNNLKSDNDARALGTNLLSVLPPTRRETELKITQRFDTTTTYNRMVQATVGSVELVFTGQAITAEYNNKMTIRLPKVYNKSGDAEVGGSGEILKTEIVFDCIQDTTTSVGRDIAVTVINNVGSYTSI